VGMVKRIDAQHIGIAVRWKRKVYAAVYRHESLAPHPVVGSPALRLTKLDAFGSDALTYDLIRRCFEGRRFWTCECKPFRDKGTCKHIDACRQMGLLEDDRGH